MNTSPSSFPSRNDNDSTDVNNQSQWTSNSNTSNNIANLLDSAETSFEGMKKKHTNLRRSTRRRTLAKIDTSQFNVAINDHHADDDHGTHADDDDNKRDTAIPSSSAGKRIRYESSSSQSIFKDDKEVLPNSIPMNSDMNMMCSTPPKQNKKQQRRRSLAVQDGHLLLGPTSLSSGSSFAQTMSSISDVSNSGISTFSTVEVVPGEGGDRIAISSSLSSSDRNGYEDKYKLPFERMEDCDDDSVMTDKTGKGSEGISSNIARICDGVATMMDSHDGSLTKSAPKMKMKKPRKKRLSTKKTLHTAFAHTPTRRSARIRKKTSAPKVTQNSLDAHTANIAQDEQCNDIQETVVIFQLSTLSPMEGKTNIKTRATKVETMQPKVHLEGTFTNAADHAVSKDRPLLKSIMKPKRGRHGILSLHGSGLDREATQTEPGARTRQPIRVLLSPQTIDIDSKTRDVDLQANNEYVNATEKSTLMDKNVEITMEHSLHDSKQKVADEIVSSPCSIICSEGESAPFQVSAEAIQATMKEIFMELDIDSKPCVTPRLFTCVILFLKHEGHTKEQLSPIFSLLRSFVSAERASLTDLDNTKNEGRRKKLHFCSFDFSSTINPVDTAVDSNTIIESCISKLHGIIEEIEKLSLKTDHVRIIGAFVNALVCFENEDQASSYAQCSKAMPFPWPKERFRKASIQYREELSFVIEQIRPSNNTLHISFVRNALGDFIGRAIKFHLRRFFNPVPLALYSDSDDLPDYSTSRSRIHKILEMKVVDDDCRDTATADGSISAVVGLALQRMLAFFELNCELKSREGYTSTSGYCDSFCKRPASVRGIVERKRVIKLTQDDIDEIMLDIKEGHTILAGVRACRFTKSLFTWPGVSDAISDVGGWGKIESLAKIFRICHLAQEMPSEDHFTLLSDVNSLVKKIEHDTSVLNAIEMECEDSCRKLWKKFRCGSSKKDFLEFNPCIKVFKEELTKQGKKSILPFIVEANPWD